ncbi:uncharacterized protein VTP21DRAFT_8280 [Calcarisporiella thermophila]|uniref:uncharacterized protein n=1 Tax=Calcarisporiella thermophila TaxID=911321 RepID=UPI00374223C6
MEVLRDNFGKLLPMIKEAIRKADFIAIDTELTGLNEPPERENLLDDPGTRYEKHRITSGQFRIIQFGLTTFTFSPSNQSFVARPFNFFVFPGEGPNRDSPNRWFTSDSSSLKFLAGHGFDFNKLFLNGIPYMSKESEIEAKEKIQEVLNQPDIAEDDSNREFLQGVRQQIYDWLQNAGQSKLNIPAGNSYLRRLVYQELKKHNGFLQGVSQEKSIEVTRLNEEERAKSLEEGSQLSPNFRQVIDALIEAKKPLIGHNCMYDLCHLVHHFVQDLPETLEEYKELLLKLFGVIIDTKYVAENQPLLKTHIGASGLAALYEITQHGQFAKLGPKIVFEENFQRYSQPDDAKIDTEMALHEAGYDSYLTGCALLRMAHLVIFKETAKEEERFEEKRKDTELEIADQRIEENEKMVENGSKMDTSVTERSPAEQSAEVVSKNLSSLYLSHSDLSAYYNRVYLMYSPVPFLDLTAPEPPPKPRPNHFFLFNVPETFTTQTLRSLFSRLEPLQIKWLDSTRCCLVVKEEENIENVPTGKLKNKWKEAESLQEAGEIRVVKWERYWAGILSGEKDVNTMGMKGEEVGLDEEKSLGAKKLEYHENPKKKRKRVD